MWLQVTVKNSADRVRVLVHAHIKTSEWERSGLSILQTPGIFKLNAHEWNCNYKWEAQDFP